MSSVRNLAAKFEQKPPERACSPGSDSNASGVERRQLSRARTNFIVAVEKDGRIGVQRNMSNEGLSDPSKVDTSGDASMSARRLSSDTEVGSMTASVHDATAISLEDAAVSRTSLTSDVVPELPCQPTDVDRKIQGPGLPTVPANRFPKPSPPRVSSYALPISSATTAARLGPTTMKDRINPANAPVSDKVPTAVVANNNNEDLVTTPAPLSEQNVNIPLPAPHALQSRLNPAATSTTPAPTSASALKTSATPPVPKSTTLAKGAAANALKPGTTTPNQRRARASQPERDAVEKLSTGTTRPPAPSTRDGNNSHAATGKTPIPPRKSSASTSIATTAKAQIQPVVARSQAHSVAVKVQGQPHIRPPARPQATSGADPAKPGRKSPTNHQVSSRPVVAVTPLDRQTASSRLKTIGARDAASRAESRVSSTVSTLPIVSSVRELKRQASVINRPRPCLGFPTKQRALDHPVLSRESQVDDAFLARMMRPTQSFSSKISDRKPITPPRSIVTSTRRLPPGTTNPSSPLLRVSASIRRPTSAASTASRKPVKAAPDSVTSADPSAKSPSSETAPITLPAPDEVEITVEAEKHPTMDSISDGENRLDGPTGQFALVPEQGPLPQSKDLPGEAIYLASGTSSPLIEPLSAAKLISGGTDAPAGEVGSVEVVAKEVPAILDDLQEPNSEKDHLI